MRAATNPKTALVAALIHRSVENKLMKELYDFKVVFGRDSLIDTLKSLGVSFRQSCWNKPKDVFA